MTSPSMKSTEKKTPEKKASTSAEPEQTVQEEQQQTSLKKFLVPAWLRVFRFANLLSKQG